ncbi:MAG: nSTAND1 domain-containing NTPase [Myxococcaceae bacterium]
MPETPTPAAPSLEALTGRSLGDFVLRDKLGQGAFGAVYRAEQPSLSREAVVKVLLGKEGHDDEAVKRFLREAKLAAQLDHPYAAHVYAFGAEPDGMLWIALENVRGTTLHQLLKTQGPLPLNRFVALLEGICEVVQTAHEQGIIHRDLKPANVMVMIRAGRLLPKLLDFGIARLRVELTSSHLEPTDLSSLPEQPLADSVRTELTQGGKLIGSPHYMAPEQWLNAHTVDARADVYALGVLSYQCLTGKLPFPGATVKDVAREHATRPVPPLPPELPAALSSVLQRAMAKKPEDRIASASELAAQVREAAGLAEEPGHVSQLADSLKETLIAEAPQPLAEAVAALEAARSTVAAIEATTVVVKVVARLLSALALAARARVGEKTPLAEMDPASVARALIEPFTNRPNAHPVPELVTFLVDTRRSAELFVDPKAPRPLSDRLRGLTQLLSATSFLSSYLWAVARPEGLERWMGVRRPSRTWVGPTPADVPHGQVALCTREGKPVLLLHPLVQVLAPAPGVGEELFVFEGLGRYGAKLVAYPTGFERYDEAAWEWLALDEGRADAQHVEAPYRGLAAFTANDRDNFFGREREVQDFLNRLRLQPLVAVVGPSGAGKSSFVQAGALPALPANWKPITVRPGPRPLLALEEKLRAEGLPVNGLRESPATLGARFRSAARERGVTWVLIVDQFEELLTLCFDPDERRQYAEALISAASSLATPVRLVLTLRDDFLLRLQQLPPLRDRLGHGLQLLATPADADLLRILVEPARRVGYAFDDPELPQEMVDAVAQHPGALALLSFTASQLWAMRDRALKMLARRAYDAMGGVGGALAHHAEATLALFSEAEQGMVREAFRNLVTAEGTRAVLSRREMEQLLGGEVAAGSVIERLILARLLVSSEGTAGEDRLEVIHEALLTSWPRLVRWQREDADNARMRDLLRSAARQWKERGQSAGLLWRGDALTEYRLWRTRTQGALTDVEEAFALASIKEHTKGRRVRMGILAGAFAALISGLIVVSISQHQARLSERAAAESLLNLYEEQGRQLILGSDYLRGLVYLNRAYNGGHQSAGLRYLAGKAAQGLGAQRSTLAAHQHPIISAAFSPDGRRVITVADEESSGRLWDGVSGGPVAELIGHESGLIAGWFSSDGSRLYTVARDGTVRFWIRSKVRSRRRFRRTTASRSGQSSPATTGC